MEEQEKKETKKVKELNAKKIILILILIAGCIYIFYAIFLLVLQPTNIFTIEEGEVYQEETQVGYIIRDEQVIKGENYANGMEKIKAEGEKVAKGDSVFRYYSKNEEELKNKISELDNKIQEVMENEKGLYSSDMKIIENQIDEKIKEIRSITDISKLKEEEKEINELVIKKAKIAGDLSPQGSYLNELITQRSQLENELNSGAEYVVAPESGIVSYRVDGLEEQMKIGNVSEMNREYLDGLNLKTGKIIATNEECGKIISIFNCYIIFYSDSEDTMNAKVGDSVKIRFSNNDEIDAKITNINNDGDGRNLVLRFNQKIDELLNYRKISFDVIWWKYSGLKVPNDAIENENELNYVYRRKAGYQSKILVKVVKQNEDYSIITSYTTEELKKLGLSNEEIDSYKKISLYDEVVIKQE